MNLLRIGSFVLMGVLCITVITHITFAQGTYFSRNLSLGDRGSDVVTLQQTLNQSTSTRVAFFGPGSLGLETDYFGPLTRAAVIRFQHQHASEVLTPLGLAEGTGFVGPATRAVLNRAYFQEGSRTQPDTSPTVAVAPTTVPKQTQNTTTQSASPRILSVSPTSGPAGTRVTLHGEGFTATGNDVYASFDFLEDMPSDDGTISFVIKDPFPESLDIPEFVYEQVHNFQYGFYIKNQNGTSNTVLFTLEF